MAVINVVKWDAASGVFAWKFPECELSAKTQLIVSESQEAIMLKEGRMAGPFGAGRHTLSSDNYPILTTLLNHTVTGRSPFTAEVWFIQKTSKLNIKWGTLSPIQVEDPQYHIMLPIRAYGQYGLQIEDSAKFLFKLVGTLTSFSETELSSYFKGIILSTAKDLIAKHVIERNISILKISAFLKDLSKAIESCLIQEIQEYGVRITNFNIGAITTDDNDSAVKKLRDALAEKAEMDIVGYNYQQKRTFDTMQTAAGNEGNGNLMNAGVGMGMGFGLGVPAGNMMANMGTQLQSGARVKCPKCGGMAAENTQFCPSCGTPMHPGAVSKIICDKCGFEMPAGTLFCPHCGDSVNSCPSCGADNPDGASVCIKCGVPMPVRCPNCKEKVPAGHKFCGKCGSSVVSCCPKCHAEVAWGALFCPKCGEKIG